MIATPLDEVTASVIAFLKASPKRVSILATEVGCSQAYLSQLRHGARTTLGSLIVPLARSLGLSPNSGRPLVDPSDILRERINNSSHTVDDLAEKTHIDNGELKNFISGSGLSLGALAALCKYFKIDLSVLKPLDNRSAQIESLYIIEADVIPGTARRASTMFSEEVPIYDVVPKKLQITEDEARLILSLRNTGDAYHGFTAALEQLQVTLPQLPHSDLRARIEAEMLIKQIEGVIQAQHERLHKPKKK